MRAVQHTAQINDAQDVQVPQRPWMAESDLSTERQAARARADGCGPCGTQPKQGPRPAALAVRLCAWPGMTRGWRRNASMLPKGNFRSQAADRIILRAGMVSYLTNYSIKNAERINIHESSIILLLAEIS